MLRPVRNQGSSEERKGKPGQLEEQRGQGRACLGLRWGKAWQSLWSFEDVREFSPVSGQEDSHRNSRPERSQCDSHLLVTEYLV